MTFDLSTFSRAPLCFYVSFYCQTPVLGLGLGVDFTFAWDNHNNENHNNHNHNNPHLNFMKGTVLGDKEQEVGIRVKGQRIRDKT